MRKCLLAHLTRVEGAQGTICAPTKVSRSLLQLCVRMQLLAPTTFGARRRASTCIGNPRLAPHRGKGCARKWLRIHGVDLALQAASWGNGVFLANKCSVRYIVSFDNKME